MSYIGLYFFFCPQHEPNNNNTAPGIDTKHFLEGVGKYPICENCLMDRILGKCSTRFSIFILCCKIF